MAEILLQLNALPANTPFYMALVILAGLLMGVAPSSLPLMSVVVGSVAGHSNASDAPTTQTRRRAAVFASGFVLGIATIDGLMGALFAFVGFAVVQTLAGSLALTNLFLAGILAVMGLALLRVVRLPGLGIDAQEKRVDSFFGAYALGIPFGLSTCPACTPMILPVLGGAAATGSLWLGAALMFAFGIARGVPLVLVGTLAGGLKGFKPFMRWVPRIERVGGVLILIAAAYFLYESSVYAGWAPALALPSRI